jgi:regulator of sigma E protease
MEILTAIFYFIIVIGILVFIHEFGHFIAARSMKMRAEIFSFGMGPRLFGYNKINKFTFGKLDEKIELGDHTDYRVCAFPIGGFVKISGMIDESMDKEFLEKPPQPWEYRSRPVWQRMIVITAGVIMNMLLAFFIFYGVTLYKGKSIIDTTQVGYVADSSVAYQAGFKPGDKILSINNTEVRTWDEITTNIYLDHLGEPLTIRIQRNGVDTSIFIPKENVTSLTDKSIGISPDFMQPAIIDVLPNKPAASIGLKSGDVITKFNGEDIKDVQRLITLIKTSTGKESVIEWNRDGTPMSAKVSPTADSTIGIQIGEKYTGPEKIITYNVISAIPKSFHDMYYYGIELFYKSIAKIVKGDIEFKKAIGGPIKIASASAQSARGGFLSFITFVALLSMSLAVINILPFPALDGGHFIILCVEGIFRKPVPAKIQIALQYAGFIILMAFMAFVIYNDIISIK